MIPDPEPRLFVDWEAQRPLYWLVGILVVIAVFVTIVALSIPEGPPQPEQRYIMIPVPNTPPRPYYEAP